MRVCCLYSLKTGTTNTAVVQGNAALTSVGINGGNLVVCGTITAVDVDVNGGNTTQSCSTFDFAGTNAYLSAFSSVFASLPSTGAPARVDNQFTFNVSEGTLVNIYNVPPQFFDNVEDLIINAPNGVFLVININGTNNTFADFQTILNGGVNQSTIIYNFFNASSLALNGIAVEVSSSR